MGLGVAGSALQYAGTGAMTGAMFGAPGIAVGAGVGAVIGGFIGYMDRKEEREKAESEKKKEADSQRAEKQEGILTRLAEREVKLMLDGNRLGQGLAVTNYRVN
jgi:phage tail tape-measure protein